MSSSKSKLLKDLPVSEYDPMVATAEDYGSFTLNILSPQRHHHMIQSCVWKIYSALNGILLSMAKFVQCRMRIDFVFMQILYVYMFFRRLVFKFSLPLFDKSVRDRLIREDFLTMLGPRGEKLQITIPRIRMLYALQRATTMSIYTSYTPTNKNHALCWNDDDDDDDDDSNDWFLPPASNDFEILKLVSKKFSEPVSLHLLSADKNSFHRVLHEATNTWETHIIRNFKPLAHLINSDFLRLYNINYSDPSVMHSLRRAIIRSSPYDIFSGMVEGMQVMLLELRSYMESFPCGADKNQNCTGKVFQRTEKGKKVYKC